MFGRKKLAGKRIVMVIAHEKFRDEELLHTKDVLTRAGAEVKIASSAITPAVGMLGARVKPDMLLSQIDPTKYDAIIFVGGMGAERYFNDPTVLKLARDAYSIGKVVCAICIAPSILAIAGILNGKRATVWSGEKYINYLRTHGARYTAEAVTVDGRIITANGPQAAKKFGEAIVEALSK